MSSYTKVGFTQKSHGVKGEIKIKIHPEYIENVVDSDMVFIDQGGKKIPYFLESIRGNGKLFIAKFEDVDSPEKAKRISSCELLLPDSAVAEVQEEPETELEFGYVAGYLLEDKDGVRIGKIEEVLDYPQQEMALVVKENKEILIPLHRNNIIEVDEKKQTIRVDIPDGLLEL